VVLVVVVEVVTVRVYKPALLVQGQPTKDTQVVVEDTLVERHLAEVVEVAQEQLDWTGLQLLEAMAVQDYLHPSRVRQ
jgi:hypothetical protein